MEVRYKSKKLKIGPLKFTTPVWKKEILPVADNSEPEELFNVQSQPEPEKIVPRRLIGLEL